MERSEWASFGPDSAAGAQSRVNACFAIGRYEDAFVIHAVHRAQPSAEVIPALVRVAFVFFYDCYT